MSTVDLRCGNVLDVLMAMPDESVHCVVTSPPYYGLRSYSTAPQIWMNGRQPCVEHQWASNKPFHKGQVPQTKWANVDAVAKGGNATTGTCSICGAWQGELGNEPSPELYVEHLVRIFREVKRVLRDDGVLFLNLGDSHWGGKGRSGYELPHEAEARRARGETFQTAHNVPGYMDMRPTDGKHPTIKPKDLIGIPWMAAFALRSDGWYLREDIIWAKQAYIAKRGNTCGNAMPESVKDRPTVTHEYVFLFSKSKKYFWDKKAISLEPLFAEVWSRKGAGDGTPYVGNNPRKRWGKTKQEIATERDGSYSDPLHTKPLSVQGKNMPSVWQINTKSYRGAHFATMSPDLAEICVLAGTSEKGCCPRCGSPYERIVSRNARKHNDKEGLMQHKRGEGVQDGGVHRVTLGVTRYVTSETTGWRPTCTCNAGEPIPATVMDIFSGAGTTGVVSVKHGRNYIGIDLNPEYIEMSRKRIEQTQMELV